MGFTLIKGTFHVVNYSPDGDSIRFQPNNRDLIVALQNGDRARFNLRGHVQTRIEAIDTLETHFSPPGGGTSALHQPLGLAGLATDGLLNYLNITNVVWDAAHRNVVSGTRDRLEWHSLKPFVVIGAIAVSVGDGAHLVARLGE